MKLTKAFMCVLPGEIYPAELAAGEECPPEYEDSARAQGCLPKGKPAPAAKPEPEPKPAPEAAAKPDDKKDA
jgi:hypothetical protein